MIARIHVTFWFVLTFFAGFKIDILFYFMMMMMMMMIMMMMMMMMMMKNSFLSLKVKLHFFSREHPFTTLNSSISTVHSQTSLFLLQLGCALYLQTPYCVSYLLSVIVEESLCSDTFPHKEHSAYRTHASQMQKSVSFPHKRSLGLTSYSAKH